MLQRQRTPHEKLIALLIPSEKSISRAWHISASYFKKDSRLVLSWTANFELLSSIRKNAWTKGNYVLIGRKDTFRKISSHLRSVRIYLTNNAKSTHGYGPINSLQYFCMTYSYIFFKFPTSNFDFKTTTVEKSSLLQYDIQWVVQGYAVVSKAFYSSRMRYEKSKHQDWEHFSLDFFTWKLSSLRWKRNHYFQFKVSRHFFVPDQIEK